MLTKNGKEIKLGQRLAGVDIGNGTQTAGNISGIATNLQAANKDVKDSFDAVVILALRQNGNGPANVGVFEAITYTCKASSCVLIDDALSLIAAAPEAQTAAAQ